MRCTRNGVTIYHDDEVLWTHPRIGRGERSTIESHLPEHRRELRHRSRTFWVGRARAIGPEIEHLVEAIFASDDVLLKLRKVQAVVTHLKTFPPPRALAAARALHYGSTDYHSIKSILRKGLDLEPVAAGPMRPWAQGSRFARRPELTLFPKEQAS